MDDAVVTGSRWARSTGHEPGQSEPTAVRARGAVRLRSACLALALAAPPGEPFHVVAGYTVDALQEVNLEDGKRVFKASTEHFLGEVAPDIRAELLSFGGVRELTDAVKSKRVDVVGGTSNQFLEMSRHVSLDPAMVAETAHGVFDDVVLVVHRDDRFVTPNDLKGRRLMVPEEASESQHRLWLETWTLREAREPIVTFFGEVIKGRTSSQVILACFFDRADACLVPKEAFDLARERNPQTGERLRVMGASSGLLGAVVAFRQGLDPGRKAHMAEIMSRLHEDFRGRQILNLFRRTRMVPFKPEYLEAVRALQREHDERMKAYRSRGRTP